MSVMTHKKRIYFHPVHLQKIQYVYNPKFDTYFVGHDFSGSLHHPSTLQGLKANFEEILQEEQRQRRFKVGPSRHSPVLFCRGR